MTASTEVLIGDADGRHRWLSWRRSRGGHHRCL